MKKLTDTLGMMNATNNRPHAEYLDFGDLAGDRARMVAYSAVTFRLTDTMSRVCTELA
jgi:hypothetical protein